MFFFVMFVVGPLLKSSAKNSPSEMNSGTVALCAWGFPLDAVQLVLS